MYIDSTALGSYISRSSGALVQTAPGRGGYEHHGYERHNGFGARRGFEGRVYHGPVPLARLERGFLPPNLRIAERRYERLLREGYLGDASEGLGDYRHDEFRRLEARRRANFRPVVRRDTRRRYWNAGLRRWSFEPWAYDASAWVDGMVIPNGWYRWWNPAHRRFELRRR